jgi:hypothetical protein
LERLSVAIDRARAFDCKGIVAFGSTGPFFFDVENVVLPLQLIRSLLSADVMFKQRIHAKILGRKAGGKQQAERGEECLHAMISWMTLP